MNAVTQLDVLDLESLIEHYDVGELVRYQAAVTGIENSNYFITTAQRGRERHFVLTLLERPSNAGRALVPLLDACVAAGLPVPAVMRTRRQEAYTELSRKPALLCQRLPGRHVYNPTTRQIEAVGRFLGRLHLATAHLDFRLPDYPRNAAWLRSQADVCSQHLGYAHRVLMADVVDRITRYLSRADVAALPRGPIHGDLFRDNLLFNEQGLTGVLDFHHAADGYLIYDLAVAANDWCTDGQGALDPERVLALLRAYHGIRPLVRVELWSLPLMLLYAALAFWLSRLVVTLAQRRGAAVRANNPDELRRIVAHHNAHFLYLDERLLD
ncbi:MAG: homoserine kinase [Pseudomonadales bacterium]